MILPTGKTWMRHDKYRQFQTSLLYGGVIFFVGKYFGLTPSIPAHENGSGARHAERQQTVL